LLGQKGAGAQVVENRRFRLDGRVITCEIGHKVVSLSRRAGRAAAVTLGAVLALSSGAGAQIPKTVEHPYVAPSDQALVVFSRPRRRQASEVEVRVVNQGGRCLALLKNDWHMAAPMWPGKHMLMLVTGTAPPTVQLMQVRLSAGKTYVVKLRARVNSKNPIEIEVVRRADQPLEAFPPEVRALVPAKPDLRKCTEWVSWKSGKIESRAERVKHDWDQATDERLQEHTVRRNDGWTAAEVRGD
jgi:hypothetical protein